MDGTAECSGFAKKDARAEFMTVCVVVKRTEPELLDKTTLSVLTPACV